MALSVEVIGFAGAAPMVGACSSYLVSDGAGTLLLDCGPGTVERLWRRGALAEIDAVVISHMHLDHMLDLAVYSGELLGALVEGHRPELCVPMGGGRVLEVLDGLFGSGGRFARAFRVREYAAADVVSVGSMSVTFAPTDHAQPCFAARVSASGAALVYGGDGRPTPEFEALLDGADLALLEATYASDASAAALHAHMTAEEAIELAARTGVKRVVLTHLLPGELDRIATDAGATGGPAVELAAEGLRLAVA